MLKNRDPYGRWTQMARRWRWAERATAWDIYQRDLLACDERQIMAALRDRRVAIMEENIGTVREVLHKANLEEADEQQARDWLPQMRVFLRDMLVAERQEYEPRLHNLIAGTRSALAITADDLRAAQRELDQQESDDNEPDAAPVRRRQQARVAPQAAFTTAIHPPHERTLHVCMGHDGTYMLDLAVLRAVRSATGLAFHRTLDATRDRLDRTLRRERAFGRPVELLHIAARVSAQGVELYDGYVDGNWLSERLMGVRVLLLAGCQGDHIGDWLGVVPHVIALGEDIDPADAAVLTQHFWHNIGLGQDPDPALTEALTHWPPALAEHVIRW